MTTDKKIFLALIAFTLSLAINYRLIRVLFMALQ